MVKFLGIDVGGTTTMCGLVEDGAILESTTVDTGQNPQAMVDSALQAARKTLEKMGLTFRDVSGVGIGVPAFMNPSLGTYRFPNIPNADEVDLSSMLKAAFECRVTIGNDADYTALGAADHIGEFTVIKDGQGSRSLVELVLITVGTGIGGGVIVNCDGKRKILSGKGGLTEPGHMKVTDCPQYICGCGKVGCVEATSSCSAQVTEVSRQLEHASEEIMKDFKEGFSAEDVDRLSATENTLAKHAMRNAGKYLGIAASNLVNALNPSVLAFTGGGASPEGGSVFYAALLSEMEENTLPEAWNAVKIVKNPDAKRFSVLGAARDAF